jgi:hypothetical protein
MVDRFITNTKNTEKKLLYLFDSELNRYRSTSKELRPLSIKLLNYRHSFVSLKIEACAGIFEGK